MSPRKWRSGYSCPGRAAGSCAAHGEGLAEDECEPSAGDGDDGIPDQANGRVGHLKLPETLPCGVAVDARSLNHLARNGFKRGVKAEREVPDLAGENQQDDAHLNSELVAGNERNHGQNDGGKKLRTGIDCRMSRTATIQGSDARIIGGDVAIDNGEGQAKRIGDDHADNGVKRINRQSANRMEIGTTGTGLPSQ